MTLLRTRVEKKKISDITAIAPTKAATRTAIKPERLTEPAEILPPNNSITRATPSPAPLLMPKTLGPASGLRKAVCSISPLTANAPPASRAVSACGSRDCRMMYCHDAFAVLSPKRIPTTSAAGMDTDPTRMLRAKSSTMVTVSSRQQMVPLFMRLGVVPLFMQFLVIAQGGQSRHLRM